MLVTSCTTDAGAGVTAVKSPADAELPLASFTITNTATITMTRPTAPHAIMAPDSRRGWGTGAGRPPGRGVLPPLPPPGPPGLPAFAVGAFPVAVLPVTDRLWARLRSLALWPADPPGPLAGLGLFPPVWVLFWS